MGDHRQGNSSRRELRREHSERWRWINAIRGEDFSQLEEFLTAVKNKEDSLKWGLCYCCQHGFEDVATWFLEKGASPSCKLSSRLQPIHVAARRKQHGILTSLLEHGAEIAAKGHRGRNALMYARDPETVKILLESGAKIDQTDDQGSTPLMRALLDNKDMRVADELLRMGASTDARDKRGRTLLVQAVWKNRNSFVKQLIDGNVDLGQADNQQRNVFHHFAMELSRIDEENPAHRRRKTNPFPKQSELIKILVQADPSGQLMNAQDRLGRTPLHWAAMSGNSEFVRKVLEHSKSSVNKPDKRGQTPLHLAAAYHHTKCMMKLLDSGADVNLKTKEGLTPLHIACNVTAIKRKSAKQETVVRKQTPEQEKMAQSVEVTEQSTIDLLIAKGANIYTQTRRKQSALHLAAEAGNWPVMELLLNQWRAEATDRDDHGYTPLHYACMSSSVKYTTVRLLISKYRADPNQCTKNGKTSLHLAAHAGNWEVAKYLLEKRGMNFTKRDNLGGTALHYAAEHPDWAVEGKEIVDLFSPWRWASMMSPDAVKAAEEFKAHIMDFRTGKKPTVSRHQVHELLYAEKETKPGHPAFRVTPPKRVLFRWIHLPVNNLAWCMDLLTKDFIENKALDIHTFSKLERSFSHQHKGLELHARYMTPLCHAILPTSGKTSNVPEISQDDLVNPKQPGKGEKGSKPLGSKGFSQKRERVERALAKKMKKNLEQSAEQDHDKQYKHTPAQDQDKKMKSDHWKDPKHSPHHDRGKVESELTRTGSMYMFTPYLHYENLAAREEMSKLAHEMCGPDTGGGLNHRPGACHLLRAHLPVHHRFPLHMRRTLDQYFYHNIDTKDRDVDQVIHRYQEGKKVPRDKVKILMVDQLWMWVLHDNLVVTSFPQSWSYQPMIGSTTALLEGKDDIWDDIRDILLTSNRPDVADVHELATFITGRCFSAFDRQRLVIEEESLQYLDMFESELGSAIEQETKLFKKFDEDVKRVEKWFEKHAKPKRAVNKSISNLFGIRSETELLTRIKDIIDELDMLSMIFDCQLSPVLEDMQQAMKQLDNRNTPAADAKKASSESTFLAKMNKGIIEQKRDVSHPREDVERMKRLAERTRGSVKDLLDLKQKQVNIIEARASRKQVEGTAKQGTILMVFTIVSVIFLPLSFISSFFTISIREFPQSSNGNNSLPIAYVARYLFGVGFPLALLCVFAAWKLHKMGNVLAWIWEWFLGKCPRVSKWVEKLEEFRENLPWNRDSEHLSEADDDNDEEEGEELQLPQQTDIQPSYGLPPVHELAVLRAPASPIEPHPSPGLRRARPLDQMETDSEGYWRSQKGPHRGAIFISVQ